MQSIDEHRIAELQRKAAASPRRRANDNIHPTLSDPVQRLLYAFETDSYVRPHRHTTPEKWEMFIILAGRAAVLELDGTGRILQRVELDAAGPVRGIEIPAGAWHTVVALVSGTVLLEIKPGPYAPFAAGDVASWAPAEGSLEAAALIAALRTLGPGDDAAAAMAK